MKTQFVDKGIPVVLGEYDTMRRSSLTGLLFKVCYQTGKSKWNSSICWDVGTGVINRQMRFEVRLEPIFTSLRRNSGNSRDRERANI